MFPNGFVLYLILWRVLMPRIHREVTLDLTWKISGLARRGFFEDSLVAVAVVVTHVALIRRWPLSRRTEAPGLCRGPGDSFVHFQTRKQNGQEIEMLILIFSKSDHLSHASGKADQFGFSFWLTANK